MLQTEALKSRRDCLNRVTVFFRSFEVFTAIKIQVHFLWVV